MSGVMERNSGSKLLQMQARFQQRQMAEKEQKMVELYEAQQARALERVGATVTQPLGLHKLPQGKVRAMFEERRSKAGVDRSKPLQPLNGANGNKTKHQKSLSEGLIRDRNHNNPKIVNSMMTKPLSPESNYSLEDETFPTNLAPPTPLVNYSKPIKHTIKENTNGIKAVSNQRLRVEVMNSVDHTSKRHQTNIDKSVHSLKKPDVKRITVAKENVKIKQSDGKQSLVTVEVKESKPDVKLEKTSLKTKLRNVFKQSDGDGNQNIPSKSESNPPAAVEKPKAQPKTSKTAVRSNAMRGSSKRPSQQSIQDVKTAPCSICNRQFAVERLATHEAICRKAAQKKRKPYDALKHRLQGTEAEPFIKQIRKNPSKVGSTHRGDWRKKHEDFVNAIRNAKEVQAHIAAGGKASDLPPPPPSENPDYVQCPHCNRKFNPQAASRHIPKCATYEFNKPRVGNRK